MIETVTRRGGRRPSPLMRLLRCTSEIEATVERALEPTGLSLAKLRALHYLMRRGESVPLGQLAEPLCCGRSNVTQLIDRMESDGLVRREPDPGDRRSVRAAITASGRRAHERGLKALQSAETEILGRLGAAERRQLDNLVDKLAP